MASLPPLKKPKTGPIGKSLGKAMSMFKGKESRKEEMKEANAVKSGRITPKQYAAGEKKEGHGKGAMRKGLALRVGKLSPSKYASEHKGSALGKPVAAAMKKGGKVKRISHIGRKLVRPEIGVKPTKPSNTGVGRPTDGPNFGPRRQPPTKAEMAVDKNTEGRKGSYVDNSAFGRPTPVAQKRTKKEAQARFAALNAPKASTTAPAMKKGGCVKKYAKGGGIEVRGKTKGRII